MKFPCLVLDHDDTVVNSTATVHFPCFAEYTAKFFPKAKRYTLEEYILKNFSPGVYEFFHGEVGMTEDDMKHEQAYWHEYVQHHVPQAYAGMRELLWDYVNAGGTICVVSHSLSPNILRDYRENGLPEPELVYGWEVPKERRKPQPYALFDIMEKLHFAPGEMLVLDDLKPGYDMARRTSPLPPRSGRTTFPRSKLSCAGTAASASRPSRSSATIFSVERKHDLWPSTLRRSSSRAVPQRAKRRSSAAF